MKLKNSDQPTFDPTFMFFLTFAKLQNTSSNHRKLFQPSSFQGALQLVNLGVCFFLHLLPPRLILQSVLMMSPSPMLWQLLPEQWKFWDLLLVATNFVKFALLIRRQTQIQPALTPICTSVKSPEREPLISGHLPKYRCSNISLVFWGKTSMVSRICFISSLS